MKFKDIAEFIDYRGKCPFCKSALETRVASHLLSDDDNKITGFHIKGDELRFQYHSSYKIPGMATAGSFYAFNVTLFKTKSGRIRYNVIKSIQHPGAVSANQFVEGFNNSKLFIGQFCMNGKCLARYSFCSIPLYFEAWSQKPKLRDIETWSESFETQNYDCINSFVSNKMTIHSKINKEKKGFLTEFMNLENISDVTDLDSRIKTILVFS